ncbi:hypothetical protein SCALM49S_00194 [Streptomyces californicus]
MTASKSVATTFTYDAKGNLKTVEAPAPLGTTTYTYDDLGRVSSAKDARGITITYAYDHRDRVKKVDSSNYQTVTYEYDGDGNLTQRSDGTGVIKYDFDPLSRETVRTLQNGSQTVLAYTPAGNVDTYQDPAGLTDYTWNKVNKLKELKDPKGKTTTYAYDKNDVRTTTTYPGNTVQTVTPDKSGRPEKIKATSPKGTLVDLAYTYARQDGKDGGKIRSTTDAVAGTKTSYEYDSAGRFSYAAENKGSTLNSSWQYCYDLAGNLTSQGVDKGCPRGTTYTVNDAQQITAKDGSTTNWSYDRIGNETAAASTPESTRTGITWSDHSQMTSITTGGKTYAGQYGSTDQSERIKLGDTFFHNGPLGLSATSTAGVDTGFNREPGGTLNSMTRGKNHLPGRRGSHGRVVCAGTVGVGCIAAGAAHSGFVGCGCRGGAGATIAGGNQAERENGAIGGLLGGLSGTHRICHIRLTRGRKKMTGSGAQKKLLTVIGTAATAAIIGTLAVLLGVLDGTALQAALIFGAAGSNRRPRHRSAQASSKT